MPQLQEVQQELRQSMEHSQALQAILMAHDWSQTNHNEQFHITQLYSMLGSLLSIHPNFANLAIVVTDSFRLDTHMVSNALLLNSGIVGLEVEQISYMHTPLNYSSFNNLHNTRHIVHNANIIYALLQPYIITAGTLTILQLHDFLSGMSASLKHSDTLYSNIGGVFQHIFRDCSFALVNNNTIPQLALLLQQDTETMNVLTEARHAV